MTDSSRFFNNIESSFREAMRSAGLDYDGPIIADGVLHRFSVADERDQTGWYVLHSDGVPAGTYGCWRRNVEGTWCAKVEREFTKAEKAAYRKRTAEDKAKRDADRQRQQNETALQAQAILDAAQPATATDDHLYLTRKLVSAYAGVRVGDWPQRQAKNCLLIPFATIDGAITTVEAIAATGTLIGSSGKDWLSGGKKTGSAFVIGDVSQSDPIVFCEGYSTGASIHEATNYPVVVCGDAGNVIHVAKQYRAQYAKKRLLIAADNDQEKDTNTGLNAAKTASQAVSGVCVVPVFTDKEVENWKTYHDGKLPTDFNDLRIIRGLAGVKAVFDSTLVANDEPTAPPSKDSLLVRTDAKGNASLLNHNEAAALLYREEFNELIHFDPVVCEWYQYQATGIFRIRPELSIHQAIYRAIVRHCGEIGFSASYVASVAKCLMFESVKESESPKGKVCFVNGVLDLRDKQLSEHRPDYFFTSQLPFEWQPKAPDPKPVIDWLREATGGHDDQVQLLRAWFHAVIVGRPDLQRFLEVIGFGGSGKGTLIRLCMAMVGREATHSTMLKQLEENRFETAKIFGKKLVVITDAEKWHGDVSVLKSITGQDSIRFEEKNKQSGDSFTFGGMVLIAANQHTASTDYSSGIQRRRITVLFDHVVAADKRRDLDSEFEPYLSGAVRWALDMSPSEVNSYLLNTSKRVVSLKGVRVESLTSTNPVVGWLLDSVRFDEGVETQIGVKETLTKTSSGGDCDKVTHKEYAYWKTRLYPNYATWCDRSGKQPISLQIFGRTVEDVCRNMLGKPFVARKRQRTGATMIKGISLMKNDEDLDEVQVIDNEDDEGDEDAKKVSCFGEPENQSESCRSGNSVDMEVYEKGVHHLHHLNNQGVSLHHGLHQSFISQAKPGDADDDVEYF